jgi:hypothetical protein
MEAKSESNKKSPKVKQKKITDVNQIHEMKLFLKQLTKRFQY